MDIPQTTIFAQQKYLLTDALVANKRIGMQKIELMYRDIQVCQGTSKYTIDIEDSDSILTLVVNYNVNSPIILHNKDVTAQRSPLVIDSIN